MPDFIYTLDSEPESDAEVEATIISAAPQEVEESTAAAAAPSPSSKLDKSQKQQQKSALKKNKTVVKKTTTKSKKSSIQDDKRNGEDNDEDGDDGDGPAPTIDPTFNFDLGGGGSFFDGLGGGDDFGMEDEVRAGTKPVRVLFISRLLLPLLCIVYQSHYLIHDPSQSLGTHFCR